MENKNEKEEIIEINKPAFEVSISELDEIRQKAIESSKQKKHNWRQKGVWIVCKSCDFEHGFNIGIKKRLIGIDNNGNPILKDL